MIRKMLLVAAVVVLADGRTASAQQAADGDSLLVWNATGSGALATRQPGRLVDASIGRYTEARGRAFARPEITAEDTDRMTELKVQLIQDFFVQLNRTLGQLILLFADVGNLDIGALAGGSTTDAANTDSTTESPGTGDVDSGSSTDGSEAAAE